MIVGDNMNEESKGEVLTFREAHEFLKISAPTLRRWVADRKIPYHKAGRQLRFLKDELLEWLKKG